MCLTFLNPTVFVYSSLTRSLSPTHSLACLYDCISICVCVCSEWKRSLQSSSPFPLHRRIISPPLRQGRQEVGVYIGLLYPKKAAWVEELQSSSAVSAAAALCHDQRHDPSPHQLSHPCLLFWPSFRGGVG